MLRGAIRFRRSQPPSSAAIAFARWPPISHAGGGRLILGISERSGQAPDQKAPTWPIKLCYMR